MQVHSGSWKYTPARTASSNRRQFLQERPFVPIHGCPLLTVFLSFAREAFLPVLCFRPLSLCVLHVFQAEKAIVVVRPWLIILNDNS